MRIKFSSFLKLAIFSILMTLCAATWAQSGGIAFVGSQMNLVSGWRTASVIKPLDFDSNNVLGTDGYFMVNKTPALPAYVSQAAILTSTYPGNTSYAMIDDPENFPNLFTTGTMNPSPGFGISADLFSFTVNSNASVRKIRIGLMVDNLDIADFNALSLEVLRTNGIQGTSGPVFTTSPDYNDKAPDWLFFDILPPAAGDTFIIRGVGGGNDTATLGGVTFDSLPVSLVTNAADSGPGTLRSVISNTAAGGTIAFAANLTGATIILTNGQLLLNKNLTIDASALPGGMRISGNAQSRIFEVDNGDVTVTTVILNSLTITNGFPTANGGGILNQGNLIMNLCTVISNTAFVGGSGSGGGIYQNNGFLTMNQCIVSGNSAGSQGGAIYCLSHSLNLKNCTLSSNSVMNVGQGAGIFLAFTTAILNECTIANNIAGPNSQGGAIYDSGGSPLTLNQCTVTGNAAVGSYAGIYEGDSFTLNNSIVSGNFSTGLGNDIFAFNNINYGGANLVQNTLKGGTTGPAPVIGAPLLLPLGNYGGPTPTMPPLPGSPAVDAGSDAALNALVTDQRGLPRLSGSHVDIGAVEAQYLTLVVNNNADSGVGSLRAAIADAPSYFATIIFAPTLSGQTIALSGGELLLNKFLTIDASALAQPVEISGNHASRVFEIASGNVVTLKGLTISDGSTLVGPGGGGIENSGTLTLAQCLVTGNSIISSSNNMVGGAGIFNSGVLTMNQSVLSGNVVVNPGTNDANGGGLFNSLQLEMNQCQLIGNSVSNLVRGNAAGGGLYNKSGGTATLTACTVSGNSAYDDAYTFFANGGGIYNGGFLDLNKCTLSGNIASAGALSFANGGALDSAGDVLIEQSTLSGNSSSDAGGGIFEENGTVLLNQSTVTANSISDNGGAGGGLFIKGGFFNINNSIMAGNNQDLGSDVYAYLGTLLPLGPNLINGAPLLAPLGNYGGPTQTMPPLPGSPAIDAAVASSFQIDQRGLPRVFGWASDLGAVEGIFNPFVSSLLTDMKRLNDGTFQFAFTNSTGVLPTVWATTNLATPLNLWSNLGPALEIPIASGNFQFTDTHSTNFPQRFYRVKAP